MAFDDEEDLVPPPAREQIRSDQVLCRCGAVFCIGMAFIVTIFWVSAAFGYIFENMGLPSEIILSIGSLFVGIGIGYAMRGESQ